MKNSSSELYAMLHKILIAYNNTADQRMEPKGIIVRMEVFQSKEPGGKIVCMAIFQTK